jgi:parallel beta-helix repeat protein
MAGEGTLLYGPNGNILGNPPRIVVHTNYPLTTPVPPPFVPKTRPWLGSSQIGGQNGFIDLENRVVKRKLELRRVFAPDHPADPGSYIRWDLDNDRVPVFSFKEPSSSVVASWTAFANKVMDELEPENKFAVLCLRHEPENDVGYTPAQFLAHWEPFYDTVKPIVGDNCWLGPIWMGVTTYAAHRAEWWALTETMDMDILMVDAYNQRNGRTFANMFKYTATRARSRSLPWGIAETSTHGTDVERELWLKGAQAYWEDPLNADLAFVCWFDSNVGDIGAFVGWQMERALPPGWYPQEIPGREAGKLWDRSKPADWSVGIEWVFDTRTPAAFNAAMNTARRQLGPVLPPPSPPPVPPEYGALALGSTNYPAPIGSLYVSSSAGVDATTSGSEAAPFKTLKYALTRVATGGKTIVLREGDYLEENITTPWRVTPITIQNYPGEVVRFMGSDVVTGWVQDNTGPGGTPRWRKNNWVTAFDHTPNDVNLVDPAHPESQWPEQVWIDDVPLEQVSSLAAVDDTAPNEAGAPGTFWYDAAAKVMWIGATPFNKTVRIAKRQLAISGQLDAEQGNPRIDIKGIGFFHYATSSKQIGAVRLYGPDSIVEHCHFIGNSMAGLFVQTCTGFKIQHNTFDQNGQLGIHGYRAEWLDIAFNSVTRNNRKMTATDSAAGGIKVDTQSYACFTHHNFLDANWGHGIWVDLASTFSASWRNEVTNHLHGWAIYHELMDYGLITGNYVHGNAYGILMSGCGNQEVYNNTFINNTHHLRIQCDSRADTVGNIYSHSQTNFTIRNNLFTQTIVDAAVRFIEYQDPAGTRDYAEALITSDKNAFYFEARGSAKTGQYTIPGTTTFTAYNLLADIQAATTMEDNSIATYENTTNPYLTGDNPLLPYGPVIETGAPVPEKVWSRLEWTAEEGSTPNIGAY